MAVLSQTKGREAMLLASLRTEVTCQWVRRSHLHLLAAWRVPLASRVSFVTVWGVKVLAWFGAAGGHQPGSGESSAAAGVGQSPPGAPLSLPYFPGCCVPRGSVPGSPLPRTLQGTHLGTPSGVCPQR